VIVAAALCPAAPLLARELAGADPVLPDLRQACLDAVTLMVQADPDLVAVVATGERTSTWNDRSGLDLTWYAPGLRGARAEGAARRTVQPLPLPLGVGARLLDQAGHSGGRLLQLVGGRESAGRCAALGASLAEADARVALLIMADGTARRGAKAPGHRDERAPAFDAAVERAVRRGELDSLLDIDRALASELMASGRPAWQVLAGAFGGAGPSSQVLYSDAPFGVAYLVASLAPRTGQS
jgi:hypothetical protein